MSLDIERGARDMAGAVDRLLEETGSSRVGVVGFCMGGGLALFLATTRQEVAAAVTFYGVGPAVQRADFSQVSADVIGHWATGDDIPPETVEELREKIVAAGRSAEMFWYEGTDHAFFNDGRPEVYNSDAAQLAWDRTLAFFREKVRR